MPGSANTPLAAAGTATTTPQMVTLSPWACRVSVRNFDSTNDLKIAWDGVNFRTTVKAGEEVGPPEDALVPSFAIKSTAGLVAFEVLAIDASPTA
jgi:hypothetical protein